MLRLIARLPTGRPHEFLSERSELFRPRSGHASDEVANGRLVSLEGLPFTFPAKHGEWRDWPLEFQVAFASPRFVDSTPTKSVERVCVSLTLKK